MAEGDSPARKVIRRKLDRDAIAQQDADVVHTHFARNVGQYFMAVVQSDAEHGVGQSFGDGAIDFDRLFGFLRGFGLSSGQVAGLLE